MRRVVVDPEFPQRDAIQDSPGGILNGGLVALPSDTWRARGGSVFGRRRRARVRGQEAGGWARRAVDRGSCRAGGGAPGPAAGGRAAARGALLAGSADVADVGAAGAARDITGAPARWVSGFRQMPSARHLRGGRRPITATSANRSGEPATADPDQVERTLGDRLDLLIDAGMTPGGAASTIVDVTGADPVLVRAGAISWDDIQAWLDIAQAIRPAR